MKDTETVTYAQSYDAHASVIFNGRDMTYRRPGVEIAVKYDDGHHEKALEDLDYAVQFVRDQIKVRAR